MEKRKTPVVKSVSTSEAKRNNCGAQEPNKKSRSNAEFQAKVAVGFQHLKRRGVYVEKKMIKIPINGNPDARPSTPRVLAHRNRRPDKTRFLANVLQLLSKTTASTQCSRTNSNVQLKNEKIKSPTVRRARNWKTKGLHNHVDGEVDSLIVLQSTKQIIQTPSNNSECNLTLNRQAVSTHIEPEQMDWTAPNPPSYRQDLYTTPAKASHSKIRLISNEEEQAVNRDENDVYNFFMDILESTACSIKCDPDGRLLSTNSSNVSLVIDEVVADKLKIQEIKDDESSMAIWKEYEHDKSPFNELDMPPCNSKCYYRDMRHDATQEWSENCKSEYSNQYKVELTKKRNKQRIMSSSFENRPKTYSTSNRSGPVLNKTRQFIHYKTTSVLEPPSKKKTIKSKENNIRDFIHSVKQELQFDNGDVYEKKSFFEALKTMAKNKKKQSVNFRTNGKPSDDNVCQLKTRKVLSDKSSLRRKQHTNPERLRIKVPIDTRQPNVSCYNRQAPITIYETSSDESINSNQSLEVIGYEGQTEFSSHSINVSDY